MGSSCFFSTGFSIRSYLNQRLGHSTPVDVTIQTEGSALTADFLREKGIEYADKEFGEGVTNTKLLSDDSRIPTNIPFKGKETNDVFINILNKDTKIKSGIDFSELSRIDLVRAAKPHANEIEKIFHANFTRVKSEDLAKFLFGKEQEPETDKKQDCCKKLERIKEAVIYLADTLEVLDEVLEILDEGDEGDDEGKATPENSGSNFTAEDMEKFIRR